mmetsp:Transcript_44632/g.140851  ORF Transcript_44632/g.140851 Transcript_44632/m.140851 type:complete len:224 (-) Transcript_44632:591-1262(-)
MLSCDSTASSSASSSAASSTMSERELEENVRACRSSVFPLLTVLRAPAIALSIMTSLLDSEDETCGISRSTLKLCSFQSWHLLLVENLQCMLNPSNSFLASPPPCPLCDSGCQKRVAHPVISTFLKDSASLVTPFITYTLLMSLTSCHCEFVLVTRTLPISSWTNEGAGGIEDAPPASLRNWILTLKSDACTLIPCMMAFLFTRICSFPLDRFFFLSFHAVRT